MFRRLVGEKICIRVFFFQAEDGIRDAQESRGLGDVYKRQKTKEEVAVKLEKMSTKVPQLFYEAKLYQYFHQEQDALENGIPRVFYCTQEGEHNVMVMDLLGPSLEDLFNFCGRKFSTKTALMLGIQMLARVEYLHNRRMLHRDLKPDNFVIGRGRNQTRVYIIDLGLAKKYMSRDGIHIPYKEGKNLTGTARYASISTHKGLEQSRRDDLEALAYILIYFVRGILPWQNLNANNKKEKYEKIMEKKINTPIEVLCKGLPQEFAEFLKYARELGFEEKPDYERLRTLLKTCAERNLVRFDAAFDWSHQGEKRTMKDLNSHPPTPIEVSGLFLR
eukprot:TRINITY_DN783_c0_g1_i6.p1 TRINITY_DN783_c0_g1~~TRINITY_DN783_c0_g1_i6.p1  ORF type:complete len:333 (+),score=76.02 TRINITY_DN783_c0_g1_i6:3-1001(+)